MCMAVGTTDERSLSEQWNGTTWTVVPSSSPTGQSSVYLNGVSCIGPSWCMAAGEGYAGTYQTLTQVWNGTALDRRAEPECRLGQQPPGRHRLLQPDVVLGRRQLVAQLRVTSPSP